jgi:hypothetical protein
LRFSRYLPPGRSVNPTMWSITSMLRNRPRALTTRRAMRGKYPIA